MQISDFTPEAYSALLDRIADIIRRKGLKGTTMDYVASSLGMSKRTLYELFGNKNGMMVEVFSNFHEIHLRVLREAFDKASNVLEAWLHIQKYHREIMERTSVQFFRDLDTYFQEVKGYYHKCSSDRLTEMVKICRLGVEQGVFRADLNYDIQSRLFELQMESLKRMEEVFPPEISLVEAFESITIGFLRSIVTPKGHEILDKMNNNN